jgi:hypothetical protein
MRFFDYINTELNSTSSSTVDNIMKVCTLIGFIAAGSSAGYFTYLSSGIGGALMVGLFAGAGGALAGLALSFCSYISFNACKSYLSDTVEEFQEERENADLARRWLPSIRGAREFLEGKPATEDRRLHNILDVLEEAKLTEPLLANNGISHVTKYGIEQKPLLEHNAAKRQESRRCIMM